MTKKDKVALERAWKRKMELTAKAHKILLRGSKHFEKVQSEIFKKIRARALKRQVREPWMATTWIPVVAPHYAPFDIVVRIGSRSKKLRYTVK